MLGSCRLVFAQLVWCEGGTLGEGCSWAGTLNTEHWLLAASAFLTQPPSARRGEEVFLQTGGILRCSDVDPRAVSSSVLTVVNNPEIRRLLLQKTRRAAPWLSVSPWLLPWSCPPYWVYYCYQCKVNIELNVEIVDQRWCINMRLVWKLGINQLRTAASSSVLCWWQETGVMCGAARGMCNG